MSLVSSPIAAETTPEHYAVSSLTAADGVELALHAWLPADPAEVVGVLYYIHGIQSHAAWLIETARTLSRFGIAVYALDRRGSGRSSGTPGDLPSAEAVAADYFQGLAEVQRRHRGIPTSVLGQSFGGSILASMAVVGLPGVARLIYCTPALGQQHARHGVAKLPELRALTGADRFSLGLSDEDYTSKARYLEFMANDHLMLRQITQRTRATMVAIEDQYWGRSAEIDAEVHFVTVDRDPIIDLAAAAAVIRELHPNAKTSNFACTGHYLEFSERRVDYWHWLVELLTPAGTAGQPEGQRR